MAAIHAHEHVTLLAASLSPFSTRVQIALEIKGVKYELLQEDLKNKSALLLQSNPVHKKIPVLIHSGKPVVESAIILEYIDEVWPSPPNGEQNFLPKDPYDRAVARFWADYIDKKLFAAAFSILFTTGAAQEKASHDTIECLSTIESALSSVGGEAPFFGGAYPGYPDIVMAPIVAWQKALETGGYFKFPEEEKLPRFYGWMKAIEESAPFKKCLQEKGKVVEFVEAQRRARSV